MFLCFIYSFQHENEQKSENKKVFKLIEACQWYVSLLYATFNNTAFNYEK